MNLKRRHRIAKLAAILIILRANILRVAMQLITSLLDLRTSFLDRKTRKAEKLGQSVANWQARWNSIAENMKTLNGETELRKQVVLSARTALIEEHKQLQVAASRLKIGLHWGVGILTYTAESLKESYFSTKKHSEAFCRIISRIDSGTFYWDLLLWVLVPELHSEELLGDLNEEYLLRVSEDGELSAKAWYQHQAVATIMQYFWKRVERVVTVATLIDLIERWLKR